jgi:flagellar motor switch protein FliG
MRNTHRNLRKAAVLVASLDDDNAAALLAQMTPAQSRAVCEAIEALGRIDPDEQHEVIEEFFRIGTLVPDKQPSGIELDDRLPSHLAMSPLCEVTSAADGNAKSEMPAFRFLHEAPARSLAPFLEREHPQTVAVVVAHLPPERAAEVLAGLSADLQIEVARRLVELDEADPEILTEVERGIESWLCQQIDGDRRRTAGLTALSNILGAASPRAKQHILANLARGDRQLAARLNGPLEPALTFAELEQLDSASLSIVLQHASRELLVLALAGAELEFAERVFALIEPEQAAALREALRSMGPTRLSDVEDAQCELAASVRQLVLRGEIVPDVRARGRLSVAA